MNVVDVVKRVSNVIKSLSRGFLICNPSRFLDRKLDPMIVPIMEHFL